MITVINHSLGNIGSVVKALKYLDIKYKTTNSLSEIEKAEKIILPGVGSFQAASEQLLTDEFVSLIKYKVIEKQVPIFGFCLGMQLYSDIGYEMGESKGLGLIRGETIKLRVNSEIFKIPHMGWNDVSTNGLKMFKGVPENSCFYFVHSFEVNSFDPSIKLATVDYGDRSICAALEKDNIWGAQFHPEKSQGVGLKILKNFNEI